MSSKDDEAPPNGVPTTPRRLRSGTQFGEQSTCGSKVFVTPKTTQQSQIKKEPFSKKPVRTLTGEKSSSAIKTSDDGNCKTDRGKEGQAFSSYSNSRFTCSPNQQPTLKAILESIEPNALLKNKSTTNRKTLRDLLNQKSLKQETVCHHDSSPKRTGNHLTNSVQGRKSKPTIRNEKNADHKSTLETVTVLAPSTDTACRENSEYCQSTSSPNDPATKLTKTSNDHNLQVVIKQEPPDDYWLMRNDYVAKERGNSSVQVNVKTECFMTSDEVGGQTLRISCTKPEDSDGLSNGPTTLRPDVKPDIVLKVKPRSSSLLTLAKAASDFYIASKKDTEITVKSENSCDPEDANPNSSPTYPAPVLTPENDRTFCNMNVSSDDGGTNHPKLSMILKAGRPEVAEEFHDSETPRNKVVLQHLEPVLEESTIPPVANTVELLAEPHDYLHGNQHQCHVATSSDERQVPEEAYDSDSPGPPVLEPITLIKTEPPEYLDESSGQLAHRQDLNQEWHEEDREVRVHPVETTTERVASVIPEQTTRENRQKLERCGKRMEDRRERAKDFVRSDEDGEAGHMTSATVYCQSEAGSRRRRKGRPSRRARSEGQWTNDIYCSPRYDSDNYDDVDVNTENKSPCRSSSTPVTRRGGSRRQGETNAGSGRRGRKSMDLETLWANPQLDTHAFLLWASENRRRMQQQHPDASCSEVEHLLAVQWREVAFSGKIHFLCRARDAGTDHDRHTIRKKKGVSERREAAVVTEGRTVYEEFMRLPQDRQKDLLRKWLRFFQKMLPRMEYQEFINDFKKGCKNLQLRPVSARRKNARLRNLDPSHYKMLFEKIRETRPRVMDVYNKRKAREEQILRHSFHAMVRRLITGDSWPFVRGCRSKSLGELLKDIQQLEVEEALAQIDLPLPLSPAEVQDAMCKDPPSPILPPRPPNDSGECPRTRGMCTRNCASRDLLTACAIMEPMGPAGDVELSDNPFVLHVLEGLRHVVDLPILDQRYLDAVFLGPPTRIRTAVPRESQFQNSATYRRTMLYKHIQPLLDTRGLPLTSSPLYHSHPAQYFFQDDR